MEDNIQTLMADNISSTNNPSTDNIGINGFFRCLKCYKIIALNPRELDNNGNLIPWNYNNKRHRCFGCDITGKGDTFTISRLTDELFLNILRHKSLDEKTGRVKTTYEDHVRTLYYAQTPVFILHLSHTEDKVKQELTDLIDDYETLDDVMRDAIGKVFECITSEGQYNLSIRNRLRWEIVE
jgi:hypothetical protein